MGRSNSRGPSALVGVTTVVLAFTTLGCFTLPPANALSVKMAALQRLVADNDDMSGGSENNPYVPGGDDSYGPGGDKPSHGRHKKDKLPFRTGAILRLISPWLDRACDTASDPSPYGPYGPDGDSGGGGDDGWWTLRGARSDAIGDDMRMGRKGGPGSKDKGMSYPYGPGDGDPADSLVWCNVTISDEPPQPYPDGSNNKSGGSLEGRSESSNGDGDGKTLSSRLGSVVSTVTNALAAPFGRTALQASRVKSSQWDLDGFVLMGTDFTSPDVFSGGRVFLKNQNSRKFCRVVNRNVDADDNRHGHSDLLAGALVCDEMTSSAKTEFVLELVQEDDDDLEKFQILQTDEHDDGEIDGEQEGQGEGDEEDEQSELEEEEDDDEDEDEEEEEDEDEEEEDDEDEEEEEVRVRQRLGRGKGHGGSGDWPDGHDSGKDDRPDGGGPDSEAGDWPGHGGKDSKKMSVTIRLRSPDNDMRYCAPDRRIRGSPIICDMRYPDDSHRRLTTFQLVDAAPSPY